MKGVRVLYLMGAFLRLCQQEDILGTTCTLGGENLFQQGRDKVTHYTHQSWTQRIPPF
jgi:hypothetical protein